MKTLERILPLLLAVIIQIMPLVRAVLPAAQGASSSWAIVLKIGAGLAALLGSYNAVSGATTSVAPINGSFTVQLTNGIPFKPYKMKTQGNYSASGWSANTAALGSGLYPIVPGMTLTTLSPQHIGWRAAAQQPAMPVTPAQISVAKRSFKRTNRCMKEP